MYPRHDYQVYNNQCTNGYYNTGYENNFQLNTNTQESINIAWPSHQQQPPQQQQAQPLHHKMVYPAEVTQNNNPR